MAPPAIVGGLVYKNMDPFVNLFENFYGASVVPDALDSIEQAIGVYEHMLGGTELVRRLGSKQAIDIEAAIERALRPSFRDAAPTNEREVQDALEIILSSLGVEYQREKDVAPAGVKVFRPDFVIPHEDLAIEVKLCKEGRSLGELQEQLAADTAGYKTKWKRLLVVVYDCGVIHDPYAFRVSNMKSFGVSVVVIKH
jgi:hypothetical protein